MCPKEVVIQVLPLAQIPPGWLLSQAAAEQLECPPLEYWQDFPVGQIPVGLPSLHRALVYVQLVPVSVVRQVWPLGQSPVGFELLQILVF